MKEIMIQHCFENIQCEYIASQRIANKFEIRKVFD